jgi:two-component SAPR family response regulator
VTDIVGIPGFRDRCACGRRLYLIKPVKISNLVRAIDRAVSVSAEERREQAWNFFEPE